MDSRAHGRAPTSPPGRWSWGRLRQALAATLAALRRQGFARFGALPKSQLALERAPDFELASSDGTRVRLAEELARGPVLLVFFRGSW